MKSNCENMTWQEWLGAACFGTMYSPLPHHEKIIAIPPTKFMRLKNAWQLGEDPTDARMAYFHH